MDIITPIEITDTILTGSNVPENDDQEFDTGTAYAVGDTVMVATSTANVHKTYENLVAQSAGLTADILDEDCSDISDWTDGDYDTAVSEVSPAGQFRFDTNAGAAGDAYAKRSRVISSPPNTFTLELKTYFDFMGSQTINDEMRILYCTGTWRLDISFNHSNLFIAIAGGTRVAINSGANVVKSGSSAAWQYWRFQVDKTAGEASATVEVFLKQEGGEWVSQGTVDCDYVVAGTNGLLSITQNGKLTDNIISHIDYIKIATGLGNIENTNTTPYGSTDWLETGSTNRWKCFNNVLGSQTEQATKIEYVLTPGESINSCALLNLDSDTVDMVLVDSAAALLNETAWTGASGTTQTTGWNKVGTPSDYTIDGGMIRITADAASEGQSKTVAVTPGVEYQLLGLYKNLSGAIAQYGVVDLTFVALSQTARDWRGICAAPNGNVYACVSNGDIYMQTGGSGAFVALNQTARTWRGMCVAPNGNVYACVYNGDIYMQTGGSGAFVALGQTVRNWFGMAAAPNGNVYACVLGGDIYMQTGGSGDFVALGQTVRYWVGMCAAPNGNVYACVSNGDIYIYMQTEIKATTDLTSSTTNASFSYIFTTPAGCTSIEIKLMAKTAGDIVWFDNIRLCPTEYSETVTTGPSKTDVVKTDIPEIATGILTVTINKSGTAAIGELIIGNKTSLGTMLYSPQIGITDYSTKTQDIFGNWTITVRGYAKRLSCSLRIANTGLDSVVKTLADCRSLMRVWIGSEDYSCLIVYGFYKDFSIVIPYKDWSDCALEIEGMI